MNRVLYREWFPQIIYNHHQTGPAGTVMFVAAVPRSVQLHLRSADRQRRSTRSARRCTARFDAEGKPGVTMRSGSNYSTWWNGGLRTMAYFHNMIGLLTEIDRQPDADDDSASCPIACIADAATCRSRSRRRCGTSASRSTTRSPRTTRCSTSRRAIARTLLFNIYVMGKNAIERGSTDTWTIYPRRIAEVQGSDREGHAGVDGAAIRACSAAAAASPRCRTKYYADRCAKPE